MTFRLVKLFVTKLHSLCLIAINIFSKNSANLCLGHTLKFNIKNKQIFLQQNYWLYFKGK